ncbi:MAG: phytanoyl-CoA dioxygenase family protein [Actinomycetota bacterium]
MSLDVRTRRAVDVRPRSADELFDALLPDACAAHGDLAARGVALLDLPALGLEVGATAVTLAVTDGRLALRPGTEAAGMVAELEPEALSDLVQDTASTMGLALTARVRITRGDMNDWVGWEPALRALLDGRPVHEPGAVTFTDPDGAPLDLTRSFTPDHDRDEMAHFVEQAGFLHLREVFTGAEMAVLADDIDHWIDRAEPDDGDSWWATDEHGTDRAVRVLRFADKSETLRELVADDRFTWIGDLTGDGHRFSGGAEGLVKPLGIVRGLSDLPWHKDCGQGRHSFFCSGLTCGISVTGAARTSGALGVIPGSHRANTMSAGRDPRLDLAPLLLETRTGDVTVHCSDTLPRAHPPVARPRKVVYTGFSLPPLPGDVVVGDGGDGRAARAALSDAQSRIEAADNPHSPQRYRAGRGR